MKSPIQCLLLALFLYASLSVEAQEKMDSTFVPYGKVYGEVFFDFGAGFGTGNHAVGFDVNRATIGYCYQLTPNLKTDIAIDGATGRDANGKLDVHIRCAAIKWKEAKLEVKGGLVGLLHSSYQFEYWGRRYVMKPFQDLVDMAPEADLGVTAKYSFLPFLSADLSWTNGQGYKKFSKNESFCYSAGLVAIPVKNLIIRLYGNVWTDSEPVRAIPPPDATNVEFRNQYHVSFFMGYKNSFLRTGIEYAHVFNKEMIKHKDYHGHSAFVSSNLQGKWNAFARVDWMLSRTPESFVSQWNNLDGVSINAGIEYRPMKQFRISPNVLLFNPKKEGARQHVFLNMAVKL